MKKLLLFISCSILILIVSCGPTPQQLAATATWQVYNRQVSTLIAETKVARLALPTATLTPSPVPKTILIDSMLTKDEADAILSWEREINVDDWENADEFNFYRIFDFCDYNCVDRFWVNGDFESSLAILLSRYPNENVAQDTYQEYFFPDPYTKSFSEYPALSTYLLPENALVYEGSGVTILAARQGRVILEVILRLPQVSLDQQIFYIGEVSEKQIIKLIEYGN